MSQGVHKVGNTMVRGEESESCKEIGVQRRSDVGRLFIYESLNGEKMLDFQDA